MVYRSRITQQGWLVRARRISSAALLIAGHHAVAQSMEPPLFALSSPLTASQLATAVVAHNPDLSSLSAEWRAAQALIPQALAWDDPTLSYSLAPRTAGDPDVGLRQSISLSQRIPWPGRRSRHGQIATLESAVTRADLDMRRLQVVQSAQDLFADWYWVHAALDINAATQSLLQEIHRIAESKYASARATKQDMLHAETESVLLEQRKLLLDRQRREIQATMNALLNQAADAPIPPPAPPPGPKTLPDVKRLQQAALEKRPELQRADKRIEVVNQRVALADLAHYPDIDFHVAYDEQMDSVDQRLTVGVSVAIPLPAKRRAARDEAHARALSERAQRTARAADVEAQIERAYAGVREAEQSLALYENRLLPLAEDSLLAAQTDYQADRIDFLALINSERLLHQTRLDYAQIRSDYHRRWAALEHAVADPDAFSTGHTGRDTR